jgi:PAS domain-containing protein
LASSILERVVQPVWVIDEAGLIRFANASAATTLGYGHASDLLGKPSHQTIRHGQEFHAEDYLVRRDGSLLPVEFWSAPIDLPDGRGAVVSFADVSERRRTERALAERDAILSALGQPVCLVTYEGLISYVNPAAVATLGFDDASEMLGGNAHWLVHYKHRDGSPYPV